MRRCPPPASILPPLPSCLLGTADRGGGEGVRGGRAGLGPCGWQGGGPEEPRIPQGPPPPSPLCPGQPRARRAARCWGPLGRPSSSLHPWPGSVLGVPGQGCTEWGPALEPLGHRDVEVGGCPGPGAQSGPAPFPSARGIRAGCSLSPPDPCPLGRQNPAWICRQRPRRHRAPRESRPRLPAQLRSQLGGVRSGRGVPGGRRSRPGGGAGPAAPLRASRSVPGFPRSRPRSFIHRSRALPAHSSRRAGSSVTGATAPPPAPTAQPERGGVPV